MFFFFFFFAFFCFFFFCVFLFFFICVFFLNVFFFILCFFIFKPWAIRPLEIVTLLGGTECSSDLIFFQFLMCVSSGPIFCHLVSRVWSNFLSILP